MRVFFEGQAGHVLQFDEMGFSLYGSKNGEGGRPGSTPTNRDLPEAGKTVFKLSAKCSLMFGMNFADEAMLPMVVLPSGAVKPKV